MRPSGIVSHPENSLYPLYQSWYKEELGSSHWVKHSQICGQGLKVFTWGHLCILLRWRTEPVIYVGLLLCQTPSG